MPNPKIFPLGIDALMVEFGGEIDVNLNRKAFELARYFEKNHFEGFIETVPAFASATIFYDFYKVKRYFSQFETAFEAVKYLVETAIKNVPEIIETESRIIEIPSKFDSKNSPDLKFVAEINSLSPNEVIEIFTSQTFRVFMLGFLPGFAYMGEVDEKITAPRKDSPTIGVPKGSIGIAGSQTGIYPLESPGGWQIIGKTDLEMFDLKRENPCFLQVGDLVKFYPV